MGSNDAYKKWHKPTKMKFNESGTLKKGHTYQGYYIVTHKEKYVGDPNLAIFRSAWEFSFSMWADYSPSIRRWTVEPTSIPYYDKISKLEECKKLGLNPNNPANWVKKNYNTDFWLEVQKSEDIIEKWFVEVKPKHKLRKPKPVPSDALLREQKRFNRLAKEYLINESKFEAMNAWAIRNGSKFFIFTEDQLRKFHIIDNPRFDIKNKNNRFKYRTL